MKKVFLLIIIILCSNFIFGQVDNVVSAQEVLQNRGEVYFKFFLEEDELTQNNISFLSNIISIDNIKENEITAYANTKGFSKFVDLNIDFEVLTPPSMLDSSILISASTTRNTEELDYYPSYDEYLNMMNQFATDYPNLCEVVNIGYSINGRELLFIHIKIN